MKLLNKEVLQEKDKKWLEKTIDGIAKKEGDVSRTRLYELLWSYLAIKKAIKNNKDVKIDFYLFDLDKTMGYIKIVGKNISFSDGKLFKSVANVATNFEAHPRLDGVVEMNFAYYDLRLGKEVN